MSCRTTRTATTFESKFDFISRLNGAQWVNYKLMHCRCSSCFSHSDLSIHDVCCDESDLKIDENYIFSAFHSLRNEKRKIGFHRRPSLTQKVHRCNRVCTSAHSSLAVKWIKMNELFSFSFIFRLNFHGLLKIFSYFFPLLFLSRFSLQCYSSPSTAVMISSMFLMLENVIYIPSFKQQPATHSAHSSQRVRESRRKTAATQGKTRGKVNIGQKTFHPIEVFWWYSIAQRIKSRSNVYTKISQFSRRRKFGKFHIREQLELCAAIAQSESRARWN